MNVFLISASSLRVPYPVYPLGLDYVAAATGKDHRVEIADYNEVSDITELVRRIEAFKPDIIGISLRNVDNTDARAPEGFIERYRHIVENLKKTFPIPIILGGSGFSIFPREMMNELNAEYGIAGEGEVFAEFLNAFQNKENVSDIPGVYTQDSGNPPVKPWQGNIERWFDPGRAHIDFYRKKGGMFNLQTKRGCPYRCIYCTYPLLEGRYIRKADPGSVARNARSLQDAGAKYIFVTDSVFNSDYDHSREVAREFQKQGISVPWGAFFSPTPPPEDYYKILADAGLTHVEFGTDSLSEKMLENYRKPFSVREVMTAHEQALQAKLYLAHYILLGGPGENFDSLNETLKNIDRFDKTVIILAEGVRLYPNTKLYRIAVEEGQISESQSLLEPVYYQSRMLGSKEICRYMEEFGQNKTNWIFGSRAQKASETMNKLYERGYSGPLWEFLIR